MQPNTLAQTHNKLPIGIQHFEKLIVDDYIYVDKTKHIYHLATQGKCYFLSRPRRFGKSLLISTFEALFRAKRPLFKQLWIDKSDWSWQAHPVIRLDFSGFAKRTLTQIEQGLKSQFQSIAAEYNVNLDADNDVTAQFVQLIRELSEINQVVVLIDEYDKALLDNINKPTLITELRDFLRDFYGILKSQDAYLRFVLLTGVTKFSKVSVFSGLNNLNDLTMQHQASDLLGYTRKEIDRYFKPNLESLTLKLAISLPELHAKIKDWYNGYQFSSEGAQVYNPFSILCLFGCEQFAAHWFETGTPTFLIKLIQDRQFDLVDLESVEASPDVFNQFDIEHITLIAVLYQTGYLTIKHYSPEIEFYQLSYPNKEVNLAFSQALIRYFARNEEIPMLHGLADLARNLLAESWDTDAFFNLVKGVMNCVPYDLYIKEERYYHSLIYLIIKLAGINVSAEVHTKRGRCDAVIIDKHKVIVFEFKYNQTAEKAIEQIKEKQYYTQFTDLNRPIYLAGVNFNGQTREIDDWSVEALY